MNNIFTFFAFLTISCFCNAQKSFEGKIKFSTKITITSGSESDYGDLPLDYGDSLLMYYSSSGNFKRLHLNSDEFGKKSQFFVAKTGMIYFTRNNNERDSLDVTSNSLNLIEVKKIASEKILNKNCECWLYKANNEDGIYNISYCFSNDTPKINPILFSNHKDFFLSDFFELVKRPYLKFSLETKDFTLTYLADSLNEEAVDKIVFDN
jgi:hypothetical protein